MTSTPPLIGVIMGSRSDYQVLKPGIEILHELQVAFEKRIVSAHRTPDWMFEYASTAEKRGLQVIIAAPRPRAGTLDRGATGKDRGAITGSMVSAITDERPAP